MKHDSATREAKSWRGWFLGCAPPVELLSPDLHNHSWHVFFVHHHSAAPAHQHSTLPLHHTVFAPLDPSSTQPPPLPPLLTCECRNCISKFKSGHRIPLVNCVSALARQNHVSEILGRVFCLVISENTALRNQSRFQISNTDGRGSSFFLGVRKHQQITSHIFWASGFGQRCPGSVGVASGFVRAVRRVESPLATTDPVDSVMFSHFPSLRLWMSLLWVMMKLRNLACLCSEPDSFVTPQAQDSKTKARERNLMPRQDSFDLTGWGGERTPDNMTHVEI